MWAFQSFDKNEPLEEICPDDFDWDSEPFHVGDYSTVYKGQCKGVAAAVGLQRPILTRARYTTVPHVQHCIDI